MKLFVCPLFLVLMLATSCSSIDFSQNRYVKFQSNLGIGSFFLSTPETLKEGGFAVVSTNEETGSLRANKTVAGTFSMDILISYDEESDDVLIAIVNRIKSDEKEIIEYYNLQEYNKSYKEYFYQTISNIEVNSTKTAFPNR
ncbi:MAG: hypothetical protein KIT33_08220 [Candidatus Kapabacteria bacterium]|nr:hypothetical protein [Ignavibacteriota bacterium]MCW5884939.1 hypothetical protein [Candidatus Kapabacteria bacterium]